MYDPNILPLRNVKIDQKKTKTLRATKENQNRILVRRYLEAFSIFSKKKKIVFGETFLIRITTKL